MLDKVMNDIWKVYSKAVKTGHKAMCMQYDLGCLKYVCVCISKCVCAWGKQRTKYLYLKMLNEI